MTEVAQPGRWDLPLRVIYLDHCAKLSGGEIALARMLPALRPEVEPLVILGEDGPLVARLEGLGIPVEILPLDPAVRDVRKDTVSSRGASLASAARVAPYILELTRTLRLLRPDLVHTNSLKAALYGGVAGRLAQVPVVWHVRDRIAADYLPPAAVGLVRASSRVLPTAVVANSQCTLATLPAARHGAVVDNSVVNDPLPTIRVAPHHGRNVIIGVVGRLAPWKGQHVFLEAFATALRGTTTQARIVGSALFGEDDYAASLRRQAEELGIAGQVEFRGFQEDVFAELAELDVLVHCSTSPEPFGQVVVEGMAAGLAVIAAAEGGPAEIVAHGVDGLLVPPRRPDLLADALTRLVANPSLRRSLGAEALLSSARFAPETTAQQVLTVYRRVLSR